MQTQRQVCLNKQFHLASTLCAYVSFPTTTATERNHYQSVLMSFKLSNSRLEIAYGVGFSLEATAGTEFRSQFVWKFLDDVVLFRRTRMLKENHWMDIILHILSQRRVAKQIRLSLCRQVVTDFIFLEACKQLKLSSHLNISSSQTYDSYRNVFFLILSQQSGSEFGVFLPFSLFILYALVLSYFYNNELQLANLYLQFFILVLSVLIDRTGCKVLCKFKI